MRGLIADAGLDGEIEVESAGTGGWHLGHPPDPRSVEAAAERGVALDGTARLVTPGDFFEFDLLIAMDRSNHSELLEMAPGPEAQARVRLLREFADGPDLDVPDPYYGGSGGFAEVVEIAERNCAALLAAVRDGSP